MTKHYPIGSSKYHRLQKCPAAFKLGQKAPEQKTSSFALAGTGKHFVLEHCLIDDVEPETFIGIAVTEADGYTITKEDIDEVVRPSLFCWDDLCAQYCIDEFECEATGFLSDKIGGTGDVYWRSTCGKFAGILDWKTSPGIQIAAVENMQNMFSGAVAKFGTSDASDLFDDGVETFVSCIIQPNRTTGEVELRTWECSVERLSQEHDRIWQVAEAVEKDGLTPSAGSWCKFCAAESTCPKKTGNALRALQLNPEDLETVGEAMSMIEDLKSWIAAVEKAAYQALEIGQPVVGWKLVAGKLGNTAWDNAELALKKMKRMVRGLKEDDGTRVATMMETKKMVSPTQAKKLLKKHGVGVDWLDEITHRPPASKNTLAPEADKRAAVLSSAGFAAAINSIT